MRRIFASLCLIAVTGCVVAPLPPRSGPVPPRVDAPTPVVAAPVAARSDPGTAARRFVALVREVEPALEQECRQRATPGTNCDFTFVVDERGGDDINAFQSIGRDGRPVIGFTPGLIKEARNTDELALVLTHEAAHHILNHLDRKTRAASVGAVLVGGLAQAYGISQSASQNMSRIGAQVASRAYSKEWELEADYLGSIITMRSGFDPVRGSQFFDRIPDPGDHILGSHPSRMSRKTRIQAAVADFQRGRVR